MASEHEEKMRCDVVAWWREKQGGSARIIHELNIDGTGSQRVDLAMIDLEHITMIELKSKKDKLTRLPEQKRAFSAVSHDFIVVADTKFFYQEIRPHSRHALRLLNCEGFNEFSKNLWEYPAPPMEPELNPYGIGQWKIRSQDQWNRGRPRPPSSVELLKMLWADELRTGAELYGVPVKRTTTRDFLIGEMAWLLSGKEVLHLVCDTLRAREFTRADPMIREFRSAQKP